MEALTKKTTKAEQRIAHNSLEEFLSITKKIKTGKSTGIKIKMQEEDDFITIPKKALILLETILQNMAKGGSISIISTETELSTQQAADLLNVSRPHLVKLLETGMIPFKKVGSHRRILPQDILEYENKLKTEREKQLAYLAEQAQDLNLGYE